MNENEKFSAEEIVLYIGAALTMVLMAVGLWGNFPLVDIDNRRKIEMMSVLLLGALNIHFAFEFRENSSRFYSGNMGIYCCGVLWGATLCIHFAAMSALLCHNLRLLVAVLMTTLTVIMVFNYIARKKWIAIHWEHSDLSLDDLDDLFGLNDDNDRADAYASRSRKLDADKSDPCVARRRMNWAVLSEQAESSRWRADFRERRRVKVRVKRHEGENI